MFSRKTIIDLINALDFRTHDELERFCMEFGLEDKVSGSYIKEKETSIVKHLIARGDSIGPSGSALVVEIQDS